MEKVEEVKNFKKTTINQEEESYYSKMKQETNVGVVVVSPQSRSRLRIRNFKKFENSRSKKQEAFEGSQMIAYAHMGSTYEFTKVYEARTSITSFDQSLRHKFNHLPHMHKELINKLLCVLFPRFKKIKTHFVGSRPMALYCIEEVDDIDDDDDDDDNGDDDGDYGVYNDYYDYYYYDDDDYDDDYDVHDNNNNSRNSNMNINNKNNNDDDEQTKKNFRMFQSSVFQKIFASLILFFTLVEESKSIPIIHRYYLIDDFDVMVDIEMAKKFFSILAELSAQYNVKLIATTTATTTIPQNFVNCVTSLYFKNNKINNWLEL